MSSPARFLALFVCLLSFLPSPASAQLGLGFDWIGVPPERMFPGQSDSVGATVTSPDESGTLRGYPFCAAPGGVTCQWGEGDLDEHYSTSSEDEEDLYWAVDIGGGVTTGQALAITFGVIFKDDEGIQVDSVSREWDVDIRDEYAWAVGAADSTFSADRGDSLLSVAFRVDKVGAAATDSVTFTCTVIAHPTSLGLPDETCTPPSAYRIHAQSSNDTVTMSGITVHEHGDSVHVKLTAISADDPSHVTADTVFGINLRDADVWILDHPYLQGAAEAAAKHAPNEFRLSGIDAVSVGADALGTCDMSAATCEVKIQYGDELSDTLPAGTYGTEEAVQLWVSGSLSEGEYALEFTLGEISGDGADADSLYFTVWDPEPVVTYVSTSDTEIDPDEQATLQFTVEDPGVAGGGVYDITAEWGSEAANISLSDSTLTLNDTIPQTVAVTVTAPPEGRTGTVVLTATYRDGSESDSDNSVSINGNSLTPIVELRALEDSVAIEVDSTAVVKFEVELTNVSDTADVSLAPCDGAVITCTGVPSTIALEAGVPDTVEVSVTRLDAGDENISLTVSGSLHGVPYDTTATTVVTSVSEQPNLAALAPVNPGDRFDRGACLSAAAGAVAIECDDAVFSYVVPSARTMGQDWPFALHYNSATAASEIAVAVEIRPQDSIPDGGYQISLTLDGPMPLPLLTDTVQLGDASPTDRYRALIAFRDSAGGIGTGLHPIVVEVRHTGPSSSTFITLRDTIAVVDRSTSPLGAGWSLSTDERIVQDGGIDDLLWAGADGSYRIYAADTLVLPADTVPVWRSAEPFLGDSIMESGSGGFTRYLRDGGTVEYGSGGDLQQITSASGRVTTIDGAQIRIPTFGGGDTIGYTLTSTSQLDSIITAEHRPSATTLSYAGGTLSRITTGDGLDVDFTYSDGLLSTITDAAGVTTSISYEGTTGDAVRKVDQVALSASGETTATIDYTASYSQGRVTAPIVESLKAIIDGPRSSVSDVSEFWITGWGGVRKTVNPVGDTTEVDFGQPAFDPRRVTWMRDEVGVETTLSYNGAGRLSTLTVDGSTTTYVWDDTWEAPERITGPNGDFVDYLRDGTTGLVTRVRYGNDSVQGGSFQSKYTEKIDYLGADPTLIDKVTDAEGVYQTFEYNSYGNVDSIFDPLGLRSAVSMDALGRVSQVVTVVDSITKRYTTRTFDGVGRVLTESTTSERNSSLVEDSIVVSYSYDSVGRPDTLQRTVWPKADTLGATGITYASGYQTLTTSWTYDGFGRLASKTEGAGQTAETYDYDVAGNLVEIGTPNGHTITMDYDAIGRMIERVVPSVTYAQDSPPARSTITPLPSILPDSLVSTCRAECQFPFFPNSGTTYVVAAETSTFEYEAEGLTRAVNADSEVRRSYDARGRLATDSLLVRGWSPSASGLTDGREWVAYGTTYDYDALDRVEKLTYPSQIAAGSLNSFIALSYHPTTGQLATLLERDSSLLEFHYDDARRLDSMSVAGTAIHKATFNNVGRVESRTAPGITETRSYTTSGQLITAGGSTGAGYTASGRLNQVEYVRSAGATDEEFGYDPLGNVAWHRVELADTVLPTGQRYHDALGRLVQIHRDTTLHYFGGVDVVGGRYPETLLQWYDAEGNVTWQEVEQAFSIFDRDSIASLEDSVKWVHPARHTISRNYYDPLGQMRARQRSIITYTPELEMGGEPGDTTWSYTKEFEGAWEEFIYDPLGRRVAVRNKARNDVEGTSGPMALSFDGATRLESGVNDHVGLGPVREMTWAFWVDPDGDTSSNLMYVSGGTYGTSPWWVRFNYISGELKVEMTMDRPEGGSPSIIRFGDLPTNDWSFVVMEYDGTKSTPSDRFTAYVDGSEVSWSLAAIADNPGEAITQSKQHLRVGAGFDGKLGEILVVQDAIADSATVADWYANGIDFDQSKLVAGYTWEGAEWQVSDSVSLADVGGLGNDLAYSNGTFPQAPDTTSEYASLNDGAYFDFGGGATAARLNRRHHELIAMDSPDILTWSFWLDPNGTASEMDVMGVSRGAGSDPIWRISTVDNATRLRLDLYNDSTDAMSSTYFDGLEPDSMQFVTIEYRGNYITPSARTRAWVGNSQLTKDSTGVTNVPSRLTTEGDTTRFEVGGFASDTLSRFFEGQLGEVAVTYKMLSDTARKDWYANGIAPENNGVAPDTVFGVVKHYTWHNELTDQTALATDLGVAEGSITYVASAYPTHHPITVDSTPGICETTSTCLNSATYYVWAGNQILVEDKRRLDNSERDSTYFGVVSYTHTGGIDRPTSVWKTDEAGEVCAFIPTFDWRGRFVDEDTDELTWSAYCSNAARAPVHTGADRRIYSDGEDVEISDLIWHGSLLVDQHDVSGLQYRRARYYDPLVGQFTQIDPIGMRGGLNLYGYANGDPVNFRDPSGLSACEGYDDVASCISGAADGTNTNDGVRTFDEDCWSLWDCAQRFTAAGFTHPTQWGGVRGCDSFGCGHYGAGRGTRTHRGVDYTGRPGDPVFAVMAGEITRIGYPYADDLSFRLIEITGSDGYVARQLYVSPLGSLTVGSRVFMGEIIGYQQRLGGRYPGITEHVHVDLRQNGNWINPTPLIPLAPTYF